ncbi:sulfatase-like hydrolase/transferase [Verrucomicrobiaceae bacterium R5-34]|nr:sulfatase-like hydrolase/transferase [Verrucomicrobiaceae bacterium R5-34]
MMTLTQLLPLRPLAHLTCLIGCLSSLNAAAITWSAAQNTTGKANLIEGNVVHAWSGGSATSITGGGSSGTANYTFSGVTYSDFTFAPAATGATFTGASSGAASTGDINMDNLLDSLTYTNNGVSSGTQTIGGLTDGENYQIQVFFNDQRNTRSMIFGDGTNSVTVSGQGSGWGQYAIGSFTADGTTQALTHAASGFSNIHVNAILVVESGPPPAPDTPTNLIASPGNNSNSLSWDANTQLGFLNFRIKRSTSSGGPYSQIATATTNSYYDGTAVNDTTYYYVVSKVNTASVESADSNEASATPLSSIAPPPNFLFIIADDLDTYVINAYRNLEPVEMKADGNPYVTDTPNIDRLATEGMLFHQARIMGSWTAAVCTGSRTCIMTGRNTWSSETDRAGAGSAADTLPGVFNRGVRSGNTDLPYATYRTCKNGNSYPTANAEFTIVNDATKRGNTDGSGSEWHGDRGLEHISHWQNNHRANGKPFLMYLGFSHPHDERNARETPDLVGRYGCFNVDDPTNILSVNPDSPPLPINHLTCDPSTFPAHPFDNGHLGVRDEVSVNGVLTYRTEKVIRNEIGRQIACTDWIDQQLGRIYARLEDPNNDGDTSDSVMDNTYIIFTSDHGMSIGRHGLQGKQNLYEHTWRVPYIVRGPGIAAGSTTDALVYLHDTFPTLCDIAGLDLPSTIDSNDGQSFKAVLEGTATSHHTYHYGLYSGGDKPGMRSITDGRFKLIKYDVGSNGTQVTQLFDLQENPFELLPEHGTPNLASQTAYASIRQRLEEELTRQRLENVDPYAMLGDRTLLRFENNLTDSLPYGNHGSGSSLPAFSATVPNATDYVLGASNTASLDFEQDDQNYVQVADNRALDFGANPFTIEAWVKFESMPTGNDAASAMPVVMKKPTNTNDTNLDYMFLAAAGNYGSSTSYNCLALHLGSQLIISTLAIPDTEWHHISVAVDPATNTVRFTLDSQTDTQTISSTGSSNDGPLIIGAHFTSSGVIDSAFDGLIDELSITDGFLASSELQPLAAVTTPAEFKIRQTTLSNDGTSINLTFDSTDTRLFTVQRSYTLEANSWEDVRSFIPGTSSASETTVEEIPVDPNQPKAFYRVIME